MVEQLQKVVTYIENHLGDDLSSDELAHLITGSFYNFNKVFLALSGYSVSEYIRVRRLSEANKALLQGMSVTDVAYRYGYTSLDGFSRAFAAWAGLLPSEVQKSGFSKTTPILSFKITVHGGTSMECKIKQLPAFKLAGVTKRVPMQFEGVNQEIVSLAQSITAEQREAMHRLQNIEPKEVVNASFDADAQFLKEEGQLTHLIGVLTTEDEVGPLLEAIPVQAMNWAVFPCEGPFPSALQDTMARIYAEWLPVSGYEVINAPSFSFTRMDQNKPGYAYSEVWTPVKAR
jgi:AraC family transcriptional regulator